MFTAFSSKERAKFKCTPMCSVCGLKIRASNFCIPALLWEILVSPFLTRTYFCANFNLLEKHPTFKLTDFKKCTYSTLFSKYFSLRRRYFVKWRHTPSTFLRFFLLTGGHWGEGLRNKEAPHFWENEKKCVFNKLTIKVCDSSFWWWLGTSAPSAPHLTVALYLCSLGNDKVSWWPLKRAMWARKALPLRVRHRG